MANTARKEKTLESNTPTACTTPNFKKNRRLPCEADTTMGNSTHDAALTSNATSPTRNTTASRLAEKMVRVATGRCARFMWSRRSGKIASHRQTAIAPVTVIESTMKKYSSGKAIRRVSTFVCPRSHCSSDPYLSNRKTETNPPGSANKVRTRPTPRSSPSASVSPPPRKIRATKSCTSLPNGRSRWYSHSWCAISRIISGSLHDLDDVTRHIHRVDVIDQVQKRVLER